MVKFITYLKKFKVNFDKLEEFSLLRTSLVEYRGFLFLTNNSTLPLYKAYKPYTLYVSNGGMKWRL